MGLSRFFSLGTPFRLQLVNRCEPTKNVEALCFEARSVTAPFMGEKLIPYVIS